MAGTSRQTCPGTDLYEALLHVIEMTLQPDNATQQRSRQRKEKLAIIPEYPMSLAMVMREKKNTAVGQQAAVFLKNYLQEIFTHSRVNECIHAHGYGKDLLSQLLDHLSDCRSGMKDLVTNSITLLIGMGFWDAATAKLNAMLNSNDPQKIYGAVFVLNSAMGAEVLENQERVRITERPWFNLLLQVFQGQNTPEDAKRLAIRSIFLTAKYSKHNIGYTSECLERIVEPIREIFSDEGSPTTNFALKCEILRCLNTNIVEVAEYRDILVLPILPSLGNLLTICCEGYKRLIDGTERTSTNEEDIEKREKFLELVREVMEFVLSLANTTTYFDVLTRDLPTLIYCVYIFMACQGEMDVQLFIPDVEKDHNWTLRDTCTKIILKLLDRMECSQRGGKAIYFRTTHNVFQRLNGELDPDTRGNLHKGYFWTRIVESMMYGIGMLKGRYDPDDQTCNFQLHDYFQYWSPLLPRSNLMFQLRSVWLGGIYCKVIRLELMTVHFRIIMENLTPDNRHGLVPCVEALSSYFKNFQALNDQKRAFVTEAVKRIYGLLIGVCSSLEVESYPLCHSLNALGYLIKSHNELTRQLVERLEEALVHIVMNRFKDPNVMAEINFIIAKMGHAQAFRIMVNDRFLCFIENVLRNLSPANMINDLDKPLDFLNLVILYTSEIDDFFVSQGFKNAATRLNLNTARDPAIDESAGNLLITMMVKIPNRMKYLFRLDRNEYIVGNFPKMLDSLMQPNVLLPRNVLGRLVIVSIYALPEIMEPFYETFLRNVVTSSANNLQNLRANWTIFIFICMMQTSHTIDFLSKLPGPDGGTALYFITSLWKSHYFEDIDPVDRKILIISITHIINHCLTNEADNRIMNEVTIVCDNEELDEVFHGVEYFYHLLIECLIFEDDWRRIHPRLNQSSDFDEFGEDISKRREENDMLLFQNHPFNIDIISNISNFLKTRTDPYFRVLERFVSQQNLIKLRNLGCILPEGAIHIPDNEPEQEMAAISLIDEEDME